MRLLTLTNLFPDAGQPWRGLDNVTLLHEMSRQNTEVDVRVLCMRPAHSYWAGAACTQQPRRGDESLKPSFHWVPYLPKLGGLNHWLYARGIRRALKSLPAGWKPDALLVPWLFPDACGVRLVPELKNLPMVAVAQGSDVHQYLSLPARRKAILQLSRTAHIVTRSEDLRQRLVKAGASAGQVTTLYNGVDTQTFRPGAKETARQELGLPVEGANLLFVGNFLPVKGLPLLIEAVASLHRRGRQVHLVLIGSGPLETELKTHIAGSGLGAGKVTFAGRKGPAEVAHYMRAADAVCLTSHNEGVPNVLLEAFASGRPLVSTDVGGISEIAQPSPGGGFLLRGRDAEPYADLLSQALNHLPDPETLSQYAKKFAWKNSASAYWRLLFEEISANSRNPAAPVG